MEVKISGDAKEIAALVLAVQERRGVSQNTRLEHNEVTIPYFRCDSTKELADEMMKRYGCKVTFD